MILQVLIVIFAYALNSIYPNEIITRFLLHTSLLILVLNLLLERAKSEEIKKSNLVALSSIMLLIPAIFLGFLAEFIKINYSSTKIFSYIFLSAIISFLFFSLNLAHKIKSTWKQLYQLFLIFLFRKKI
jgi:hypothetical protein